MVMFLSFINGFTYKSSWGNKRLRYFQFGFFLFWWKLRNFYRPFHNCIHFSWLTTHCLLFLRKATNFASTLFSFSLFLKPCLLLLYRRMKVTATIIKVIVLSFEQSLKWSWLGLLIRLRPLHYWRPCITFQLKFQRFCCPLQASFRF